MSEADLAQLIRDTFMVLLKLGGPVLAAALVVGLVMSLIQAITQINEPSLAFVPKFAAIAREMVERTLKLGPAPTKVEERAAWLAAQPKAAAG